MSSGFTGGNPDLFSAGGRSSNNSYGTNLNPQQQFPLRSPLSGNLPHPTSQIRRPDFIRKRSLAEVHHQQTQQNLGFYLRNVKPRSNYISALSPIDFSSVSSITPEISSISSNSMNSRYGFPILQQNRPQPWSTSNRNVNNFSLPNLVEHKNGCWNTGTKLPGLDQSEKKMMDHRLQELEKQLLGDEEEDGEETVSVVTNSEWSETIRNLIQSPTRKPFSLSPTSSSSSCSCTSASPPLPYPKQSFIDAAVAISDGKPEVATEILTRLLQIANKRGAPEQRLAAYMVPALRSRVNNTERVPVALELFGNEHATATQMVYDVSPCFKFGFMAANLAILDATAEQGLEKIHVIDFEIGQGGQYMHLLHTLAGLKKNTENKRATSTLKITTITSFFSGCDEKLNIAGERLKVLAQKIGFSLSFHVKKLKINDLTREKLEVQSDEALVVNFAFKLYKLPDESVTTENLRDELLRRVKSLSPVVMTVVEQEFNSNTAPLVTRVRDACEHYGTLFDSLDATISRENSDRVKIEESLGLKIGNSVACEGRDRVERCEMFGKWRARMSMSGFQPRVMSQRVAESLRSKLNSWTRGNPGFTVSEESGGICFGWMGRTLTVASAWC